MDMGIADLLGYAAVVTNILGNMLVAHKSMWSWPIRISSNLFWMIYVIWVPSMPVLANALIFMGINIYSWIRWEKDRRRLLHG